MHPSVLHERLRVATQAVAEQGCKIWCEGERNPLLKQKLRTLQAV